MKQFSLKKLLFNLFLFALLLALTLYVLLDDASPAALWGALRQARLSYILLALLLMQLVVACEGLTLKMILGSLGQPCSLKDTLQNAYIGYYFCTVTPSATGGQPMQLYYMNKRGVRPSAGVLALVVVQMVYQLVSFLLCLVLFACNFSLVKQSAQGAGGLLFLGIGVHLLCASALFLVVLSPRLVHTLAHGLLSFANRILPLRQYSRWRQQLDTTIDNFSSGFAFLRGQPRLLLGLCLNTLVLLCVKFGITYLIYRSLGLGSASLLSLMAVQAVLSYALSCVPLPGSLLAAEGGFVAVFSAFFPESLVLPGMLLWRGVSFYAMLLISFVVWIYVHLSVQRAALRKE